MTNEKKAREIAEKNACDYPFGGGLVNTSRAECEDAALDMAEWKDQQFNRVCEWLRETDIDGLCDSKNLTAKFIKKLHEVYDSF